MRGTPEGVAHIRRQLQATYAQVSFRDLPAEQDPAQPSNLSTLCAQLTLARPCYFPVRTFEEGTFLDDDPVKGILGAFDGMEPGERALTQIILTPAPRDWSRRYEGSARQVEKSMMGEAMSFGLIVRQFVSVIAVMTALGFGLWALLSFIWTLARIQPGDFERQKIMRSFDRSSHGLDARKPEQQLPYSTVASQGNGRALATPLKLNLGWDGQSVSARA